MRDGLESRLTMTVTTASQIGGWGKTLGYRLAASGELPGAVRIGGRWTVGIARFAAALGLDPDEVRAAAAAIETDLARGGGGAA